MSRILVHMCCGPCSIVPLTEIAGPSLDVCGFFYNPNIHPRAEFEKRLGAVKKLAALMDLNVLTDDEYDPRPYFDGLPGTNNLALPKDDRCNHCYSIRLDKAAQTAKKFGFDYFTSSLLYSKYQNHESIIEMGLDAEARYGVPFFYEDYRSGWRRGIDESKDMGLYRQKYCGCVFSFVERGLQKSGAAAGKTSKAG